MRTIYTILLGVMLAISHVASYAAIDAAEADECKQYVHAKGKLSSLYDEYLPLKNKSENAEKIFLLSRRIEQTATEIQKLYPMDYNRNSEKYVEISKCLWDAKFEEIGLSIGHYSDQLAHSGKLLFEVHRLNPQNKYRSYTLYTEIFGKSGKVFEIPDVILASSYLKEFPNGPRVLDVYEILAGFYHDLYAALREREKEPRMEERGETYSCYDGWITQHPEEAKQEHARKLGIFYFEKIIATISIKDRQRPMYLDELNSLKNGKTDNVVNICGD